MRRLLAASFILLVTATTVAQQRPNFSGTWTQDLLASRWEGRGNSNTPRRYEQTISLNVDGALVVRTQAIGTPHAIIILYRKKVTG